MKIRYGVRGRESRSGWQESRPGICLQGAKNPLSRGDRRDMAFGPTNGPLVTPEQDDPIKASLAFWAMVWTRTRR
jgi:hypothetical protein